MPAKRKKLPLPDDVQDMLDELMPVPALTDEDVDPLQLLVDAPAEEFQKAMSPALRKLMITGLRNVPAPKNLKELASVYAMYEKIEGLNKPADKTTMPVGMVIPLRAVQRRIGALPEPPQPAPSLLELEAEMADEASSSPPSPPSPPSPVPPTADDFEV